MGHGIGTMDIVESIIGTEWHTLAQHRPDLTLDNTKQRDWDIEKRPVFIMMPGEKGEVEYKPFGQYILACSDNGHVIGTSFADSYHPVTNAKWLDFVKECIAGAGHTVEVIGSICNRGRMFVTVKLAGLEDKTVAGDLWKSYLCFLTSHDQSAVTTVINTNVRTVCKNMFNMNLHATDSKLKIQTRKTKKVEQRLDDIALLIDKTLGVRAEFFAALESVKTVPCDKETAKRFYTGLIVPETAKEMSSRADNTSDRLVELFVKGDGNRGVDFLDVFNGGTQFFTHECARSDTPMAQFVSSEFGHGNDMKHRLFESVTDNNARVKMVERGDALLTNRAKHLANVAAATAN